MGLFRFFFLPEFGKSLGPARGTGRRLAELVGAATRRESRKNWADFRLPAVRAWVGVGALLAAGGGALVIYGLLGLSEAGAQSVDPGLFEVEDAGTRKILEFLSDFDERGSPVLGQMLFVFNGGVLLLAGFLLIWHTVTGSVDTAREGRWGFGAWEIVRIVTAVALMAPLPGGASGAQHIVVGLAKLGGDFANLVWKPLAVETLGKGRAIIPWPREAEWRTAIARTVVAEVCRYVANEEARAAGDDPYVALRTSEERKQARRRSFDELAGRSGNLVLPSTDPPEEAEPEGEVLHYDGVGRGMPRDMCGAIRFGGLNEEGGRGIAANGHRAAWRAVYPRIVGVAREIGDRFVAGRPGFGDPLPDLTAALDGVGVAETYRAILELNMKQASDAEDGSLREAVRADAEKAGWLAAASFVVTLSVSASHVHAAARNVPVASLFSQELKKWSEGAAAAVEATVVRLSQDGKYEVIPVVLATGISGGGVAGEVSNRSMLERMWRFIDPESVIVAGSGNPLMDLTATGFGLLHAGIAAITVFAGASVGSNFAESIPFIGKGFDVFEAGWQVMDGVVTPVIGILLMAGAVLAYLVPAIPFIRFLFGILTWLLAVVEAMLAVTVLCAAHVKRGEGQRLIVPETYQGWLFLPGLVLRPALMLFGLVIGYLAFVVMMELFNEIWVPRMRDANNSAGLSVVSFLAMLAVYVLVAYGILNACFKLIDVLPAAVLDWIGARSSPDTDGAAAGTMVSGGMGRLGASGYVRGQEAVREGGARAVEEGQLRTHARRWKMKAWIKSAAFAIGPPAIACLWVWWLGSGDLGRLAKLCGLGAAVAGTMGVFLVADRGERGSAFCAGVFTAGLIVCAGMTWLEVAVPALELGVGRFLGALVRLDAPAGLLVAGPVVGCIPVALVWFEQMGKLAGRLSNEKRKRSTSEVFGKAKLLEKEHFRKLEKRHGILLGQNGHGARAPLIAWPLEGSAITLAPPRTGKGATIALNYLAPGYRGWPGSTVLVDPRGETWCVVARRRRELGRRVVLLDPFGVVAGHAAKDVAKELHLPDVESVTYNPLDFIREDNELAPMDINVLLDAFLTPPAGNNDGAIHFYESARAIIAGYIAWVRFQCPEGNRNLQEVYWLLTRPPEERSTLMEQMRESTAIAGSLSRIAAERQMQVGEQEAGSNFSTIANQLQFLNYPALVENTRRSNFDPMDLADGDMDLFVVVPETMTEHARAWMRLWITIPNAVSDMRRLQREMLIIIDEMPKLGYLKPVMDGYNLAAGRGVHYWCFTQSISALDSTWGKDNRDVLVDLAELVQVLGFPRTDVDGADALSAAIGTAGFETRSVSVSGQSSGGAVVDGGDRLNTGSNISVVAERLVTKDEILTMPADKQLVIAAPKNMPRDAFGLNHARYWERADTRGDWDLNPLVVRKTSAKEAEEDGLFANRRLLEGASEGSARIVTDVGEEGVGARKVQEELA